MTIWAPRSNALKVPIHCRLLCPKPPPPPPLASSLPPRSLQQLDEANKRVFLTVFDKKDNPLFNQLADLCRAADAGMLATPVSSFSTAASP